MKKIDIVMIVIAVILVIVFAWLVHIHDMGMEKALMDDSWWVNVR